MNVSTDALTSILTARVADPAVRAAILGDLAATDSAAGPQADAAGVPSESADTGVAELAGAAVDLDRERRCGFPEVVFAEGKPAGLVADIMQQLVQAGQSAFATRASSDQAHAVQQRLPGAEYNPTSRTIHCPRPTDSNAAPRNEAAADPLVAVVSAGSCDAAVATEALETLKWMQVPCRLIEDVGVAGPQRLLAHVPFLQQMKVVVCVAGMEAALPSVLGGHVGCPVIGVPTSVGYGASLNGITALLSMMTCCASNVVTVNIDAGFRGGYVAGMMVRQILDRR